MTQDDVTNPDWRQRQFDELNAKWKPMMETPEGRKSIERDMKWSDHGFIRNRFPNRHQIGPQAWRSAQPNPEQIKWFADQGGKTVISLRGGMSFGSLPLEVEACAEHGLEFIIYRLYSRDLPPRDELLGFIDLIQTVKKPVLYHCKSGADRAGLASALHMHFVEGQPVEQARKQLSFKYLHLKHAKTGVLDAFFDAYLADSADTGQTLREWIETTYHPQGIKAEFLSSRKLGMAWVVDKVLRRE